VADISDVLGRLKPREKPVTICLAGDLAAKADRLEAELARAQEDWAPESLSDVNPAHQLARDLDALREQMRGAEVEFLFRAIPDKEYSDLLAAHPPTDEREAFNSQTFPPALVAASCVDPVMSQEKAAELFAGLNQGQIKALFDTAWDANNDATAVPFSLRASAILAALTDES